MTSFRFQYQRQVLTWSILVASFIGALQAAVIQIALPNISVEFNVEYATLALVVASYFLLFGTFSVSLGKLGDTYSPKKVFLFGVIVFSVGSVVSFYATSTLTLIISRGLQGLGMAGIAANGISLLRNIYPEEQRGHMLAMWSATVSIGYIVGPSIGGWLVTYQGWRTFFLWSGVVLLIVFILVMIFMPPTLGNKSRFDYWGTLLLALCLGCAILLLRPPKNTWEPSELYVLSFLLLLFVVLFIVYEKHNPAPLVQFRIFRNDVFVKGLLSGMILAATIQGMNFLVQYYLQQGLQYSAAQSGVFWTGMSIATLIATVFIGRKSDFYGSRLLVIVGTGLRILALVLIVSLLLFGRFIPPSYVIAISMVVFGLGVGASTAPINSLILGAFPSSETGVISGIYTTFRTMSSSIGIIVFGLFLDGQSTANTTDGFFQAIFLMLIVTGIGLLAIYLVPTSQTVFRFRFRNNAISTKKE